MRSRNGARHPSSRGGMNRTRGCTGLVAAPDPRPCAHSFTQSRASPPVGPRGPWSVATHLHTVTGTYRCTGRVHLLRAGRLLSVDPFPHFQFNRRRRQLSTILCISRLLSLVRSGFHPCCVCQPSPIQSISDSMTETGDTAAAVADTAVTNVDRVKRPTRPDDTETKRLIEDLQSTST